MPNLGRQGKTGRNRHRSAHGSRIRLRGLQWPKRTVGITPSAGITRKTILEQIGRQKWTEISRGEVRRNDGIRSASPGTVTRIRIRARHPSVTLALSGENPRGPGTVLASSLVLPGHRTNKLPKENNRYPGAATDIPNRPSKEGLFGELERCDRRSGIKSEGITARTERCARETGTGATGRREIADTIVQLSGIGHACQRRPRPAPTRQTSATTARGESTLGVDREGAGEEQPAKLTKEV